MPEANDCTFDALVEHYADLNLERMDRFQMKQYIRSSLIDYYGSMTENELIHFINDQELEETADELIGSCYGTNPPDCYIPSRDDPELADSSQTDYSRIPSRYWHAILKE